MKGNPFTLPKLGAALRGVRPIPSVRESVELRPARLAGSLAEQDVVIRIGIKRRVEINEVNAGVRKNLLVEQPLEIVAEKEAVHGKTVYQRQLPPASKILSFSGGDNPCWILAALLSYDITAGQITKTSRAPGRAANREGSR
jgi:hypothetical protein